MWKFGKKFDRKFVGKWKGFFFSFVLILMASGISVHAVGGQDDSTSSRLQLCREDGTKLGEYADWKSVVAQINTLNQKTAVYRVVIPGDMEVKGKLAMPGKGKYAGLVLENADGSAGTAASGVGIKVSGSVPLTGNLTLGEGVSLNAGSISGGAWKLALEDGGSVSTGAGITVGELTLGKDAYVKAGGKLTVKKLLSGDAGAGLVLTQKKMGVVKDTQLLSETPLRIRVRDASGAAVTLPQGATVLTVTGSSYASQFSLADASDRVQAMYRKTKALRVQGALEAPFALYDVTETDPGDADDTQDGTDQPTNDGSDDSTKDGDDSQTKDGEDQATGDGADRTVQSVTDEERGHDESAQPFYMGNYVSLADIRAEINRRKKAGAIYEIAVEKAQTVKGTVAAPSAKAFGKLIYSGEKLSVRGSMKLAGHTVFRCDSEITGALNGGKDSVLELSGGKSQSVKSNLKAEKLILRSKLSVGGTITVTDIEAGINNRLQYNISKKTTIKGMVTGRQLVLAPEKKGVLLSDFPDGTQMMSSVAKADTTSFALYLDTQGIFYRDKKALKLGTPRIRLFTGTGDYAACQAAEADTADEQFVTINDLIAFVNRSEQKDYVARLDQNVPSMGAMTVLAQGKRLVLCGKDGEKKTLKFTGAITLNGCTLEVHNLALDNKTSAGPKVNLSAGGELLLDRAAAGAITAKTGTAVVMIGDSAVQGNMTGEGNLLVMDKAVARFLGNVTVKELVLTGEEQTAARAQIRLRTQKKMTVTGKVTTEAGGYFVMNIVDKDDAMMSISKNTAVISTIYGDVSQFQTDNIMPGTFSRWALMKNGSTIRTAEPPESVGDWSEDYK